ncbi:Class II abasic (AP) endonuclease [Stygiomarasmius scandens]|uniref:DNA-(apurinic or apyrimidinic site) endonuclease 2 n=1 Tax=Marasmiellus scandens TaxID=2682957 RepID=A0ABR1JXD5_9AGAR
MRLLTWNISGIRTMPKYYPWDALNSFEEMLNYMEADIINFQEVKQPRDVLPALPPSYHSFFSFPVQRTGYSGVATYTRKETVVPLKAEEGITGLLHASPVEGGNTDGLILSPEERVSSSDSSYPGLTELGDDSNDEGSTSGSIPSMHLSTDLTTLDSEGRTLVLDFGLFVLINVCCPNDGLVYKPRTNNNHRIQFKADFLNVLETRIRNLLREGREVILVGDLNACASIDDYCEGDLLIKRIIRERESKMLDTNDVDPEEIFWEEKRSCRWLRDLILGDQKCFVDVTRLYHPERKGMYTCWNTEISARESNYGYRVDYILATPGLLPWIKFSDIQPQLEGSDHCLVFVDFYEEREVDGKTIKLRDLLMAPCNGDSAALTMEDPPRLAGHFRDKYSGKRRSLDSFFKGTGTKKSLKRQTSSMLPAELPVATSVVDLRISSQQKTYNESVTLKRPRSPSPDLNTPSKASYSSSAVTGTQNKKAKISKRSEGKQKGKAKVEEVDLTMDDVDVDIADPSEEADQDYLKSPSQGSISASSSSSKAEKPRTSSAGAAWETLLAKPPAPRCTVHNEEAKEFRVKKSGPNKGRVFWRCSRPVGPGYDKGWADRPREEVDPQWRCNFFMWAGEDESSESGSESDSS